MNQGVMSGLELRDGLMDDWLTSSGLVYSMGMYRFRDTLISWDVLEFYAPILNRQFMLVPFNALE